MAFGYRMEAKCHQGDELAGGESASISSNFTLMAFGYRMKAISILGREVMQPRGLIGLGHDSIDFCGPEIAQVSTATGCTLRYVYLLSESRLFKSSHRQPVTQCSFTVRKARIGLDC